VADSVRAYAPATVANVACGFDILGFALEKPGDMVSARFVEVSGVFIERISSQFGELPLDPARNTASVAAQALVDRYASGRGIALTIEKNMPIGSGLGSSAASSAAACFAVHQLLGEPCSKAELVQFAMLGEKVACGTAHADNVAPSLLGGFTLIRSYEPLDLHAVPYPSTLRAAVIHPHIEVRTEDARMVLRKSVLLSQAIAQFGNVAGLVLGLCQGDMALIGRSLEDVIIEPERSVLIPGFSDAKRAALDNGALGCSLSGSGPSIFALCESEDTAAKILEAVSKVFKGIGIETTSFNSSINPHGAVVVD
jgi:homoserine kinase